MNRIASLCACLMLLTSSLAFAGGQQPVTERIPLAIVASGRIASGQVPDSVPLLQIGSVSPDAETGRANFYPQTPTNWQPYPNGVDPLVKDLVADDKHLFQADSEHDTLIYLVGPESSFEAVYPVALVLKGNQFTLEMITGSMNIDRDAVPMPTRTLYVISLGKLDVGDYQFKASLTQLNGDTKTYPLYAKQSVSEGSVAFTVSDGNMLRMATKPPAQLKMEDLKNPSDEKTGLRRPDLLYQLPFSLQIVGKAEKDKEFSATMGTCDGTGWINAKHAHEDVPELTPAKPGDPLFAIIRGPIVNLAEVMTLREVVWDHDTAKITVEVWRDKGERDENARFTPVLLVPLGRNTKHDGAPAAKVTVAFHTLTASDLGKPYIEETAQDFKYAEAAVAGQDTSEKK